MTCAICIYFKYLKFKFYYIYKKNFKVNMNSVGYVEECNSIIFNFLQFYNFLGTHHIILKHLIPLDVLDSSRKNIVLKIGDFLKDFFTDLAFSY